MAQNKKVKILIKLNLSAGEATPAPPVGTALGPHGINIAEFTKSYNERTAQFKGNIIPVIITVFEDRTFTFITKKAPVADMIKKALRLEKGSGVPNREKVGKLSQTQIEDIAKDKMEDLNARSLETAVKIIAGTARSMGVDIQK